MRAAVIVAMLASGAHARPPVVRLPEPTVGPAYPPSIIQRVLRLHREELRRCLPHATLHLRFTIERDGRASHAVATGPKGDCVAWLLDQIAFPPPPGGKLLVDLPFAL